MEQERRSQQPAVYARLAEEADIKLERRKPHPHTRAIGWMIIGAILAGVLIAILWVGAP